VRVQRALNARNLGAGVPDGVAGPRMRDAIRAYQRSLGEPQTGELTGSQLRRLLGSGSG
jgi:peptidoglycan hydrolase-like protein with peptidoglycan-binding domain